MAQWSKSFVPKTYDDLNLIPSIYTIGENGPS